MNIFLYFRDNTTNSYWVLLDFTTEYVTNSSTCFTNYVYFPSNSSCVRNCSASFIVNSVNPSNSSSNTTNTTTNITINNSTNKNIFDKIDEIGFAIYFGKSMVITSFKIAPNFLLALTVFLDDLYFYRFHRKVYPTTAQWFMNEIDIINSLKISPWFLDFIYAINNNYIC